ncbi:MAG: DnaB-like helicase N-terminal domain-containing protein [Thermodesulfobacteriota bacterium]
MNEGILPHHTEYEEGILGAVINDPALYDDVCMTLEHADFYSGRHRMIFRAMGEMRDEGVPIHLVTLWERMRGSSEFEDAGGSSYLAYLSDMAFLDENLDYYVDAVKDDALRRNLWRALHECARAIERDEDKAVIEDMIAGLRGMERGAPGRRIAPVSAKDLENVKPPESLWADIIYPECIIQLNSEPGVGKSTLAYNICALGAAGRPFLGIPFSKKLKSLYIDLETPRFLRRNKIELICGELPGDFHILECADLRNDFPDLLSLCRRERYDLVVLDTQSRVLAMEKENDNAEANYLAGLLRRIANEAGCAILLIHHSTKGDEGKAVYRGRGASAIAGAVDVVVNVQSLSEDVLKLSVVKHRIQGSNPTLTIRKAGEDRFEQCESREGEEETGFIIYRVQNIICELLASSAGPLRAGEIVEAVQRVINTDRRTVFRSLGRLAQAGKIYKPKQGYYEYGREQDCDNVTALGV